MANKTDFTPKWAYVPAGYYRSTLYPQIPISGAALNITRSTDNYRMNNNQVYEKEFANDARQHYPLSSEGKLRPNPVLFLEQETRNEVPESNDITAWKDTNITFGSNQYFSPEKRIRADVLRANSTLGTHYAEEQTASYTGGDTMVSCFIHAGDREHVRLQLEKGGTTHYQYYDVETGELGASQNVNDAGVIKYPAGWFRCWFSLTNATGTTATLRIYISEGLQVGDEVFSGNGANDIWAWGFQVEVNSRVLPSSLIVTSGVAAVRRKERFTSISLSEFFNSQEGIFYADLEFSKNSETTATMGICNGGSSTGVFIERQTSVGNPINTIIKIGGVTISTGTIGIQADNRIRFAISWRKDLFLHYANGVEWQEDTSGDTFDLFELEEIVSHNGATDDVFDGYVNDIRVYDPTNLNATDLKAFLKALTI